MRQDAPNLRTPALARQYYRLFEGYLRFGEDLWGRSWTIASGSLRRAVEQVERGSLGLRSSEHLFRSLVDEYANFIFEMATAWPLAAETASSGISPAPLMPRAEGMGGEVPVTRTSGVTQEVPGRGGDGPSRSLALPVRFIDASQGWAAYVVPWGIATEMLGASTDMVMPFDLGGGRALVVVMGIDYRVCDLGRYQEIALALIVTAKIDPAGIPGAMFVAIGVNGEFSRDAGQAVWGLEKVFSEDLSVTYRADSVGFGLRSGHPETLSISFPRFGTRRFHGIPILIHSRRRHGDGQRVQSLQSLMSLSGHGGGVQVGGSVSIRLGRIDRAACICQGSIEDCLCNRLRRLDVTGRLPAANGWIEHLSGIFEAPRALRPVAE
ncbi:MAG: hypothetical protein WA633_17945 [Stellaceae bacterium]